jgi:predicted O-methyltransferase YrrM
MNDNILMLPEHKRLSELEGIIFDREGAHLAYLASLIPVGGTIVEIGSHKGKSACFMGSALRRVKNITSKIHCVDLWTLGTDSVQASQQSLNMFTKQILDMRLSDYIVSHMEDSIEFSKKWNTPIDLLFIDGEHHYEHVHSDWENFGKWVKKDGLVCFHDYVARHPDIQKVVNNEIPKNKWRFFARVDRMFTVQRM